MDAQIRKALTSAIDPAWGGGGDGGIRTLDTLFEYNALARRRLQPLGHVSGEGPA